MKCSLSWAESDVRQIYLPEKINPQVKPDQNHEENRIRGEKILVCHFPDLIKNKSIQHSTKAFLSIRLQKKEEKKSVKPVFLYIHTAIVPTSF